MGGVGVGGRGRGGMRYGEAVSGEKARLEVGWSGVGWAFLQPPLPDLCKAASLRAASWTASSVSLPRLTRRRCKQRTRLAEWKAKETVAPCRTKTGE